VSTKINSKRHTSVGQKALAVGMASATCLGVVGLISIRTAQEASANDATEQVALAAATTSTGVTQAQLDQYAAQLAAEQQRLEAYRLQLIETADSLAAQSRTGAAVTKPKNVTRKPQDSSESHSSSSNSSSESSSESEDQKDPAPTIQVPPSRQFVPAPQEQKASSGSTWAAPQPQAKTRASNG